MRFLKQIRDDTPRSLARDQIQRLIAAAGYRRGDQLPTYAELCTRLGVSLLTVQRAMGDLAKQGLVYRLHGKGCYVGKASTAGPRPLSQVGLVFNASIALLLQSPYLNLMLTGLLSACNTRNIDLTILSLKSADGQVPPAQLASQVDAVILLGIANEDYALAFSGTHTPLVIVDNFFPAIPVDAVVLDNAAAVRLIMQHLIGLGHRNIAYLSGNTTNPFTGHRIDSSDSRERRTAYASAMSAAGLSDTIRIIETSPTQDDEALAALNSPARPTAFLAYDAPRALRLYHRLTAAGLRVPQDVAVAGCVGTDKDILAAPLSLAYCKADFLSMGMKAIEILERRCQAARPPDPTVTRIPVEFVPGATASPPQPVA
jgi:DNA-binding LacI/PurR family transcriptional regulator